jgi:hypothetical protein
MTTRFKLPVIPAAFFGVVLGLAGLGNASRVAEAEGSNSCSA